MKYIVMTHGRKGMYLFLVDRSKIKTRWWSYDWTDAFLFNKRSAAIIQSNKLRFKNPEVITLKEAIELSEENENRYNTDDMEHPFSNEALGQWI